MDYIDLKCILACMDQVTLRRLFDAAIESVAESLVAKLREEV